MRTLLTTLILLSATPIWGATLEVTALGEVSSYDLDLAPLSLDIDTTPQLLAVQRHFVSGPYYAQVAGYPDAVLHLHLDVGPDLTGAASAWITSSLDDQPGRILWWPEPVTAAFTLLRDWVWVLPDPPLIPGTDDVFTAPRELVVSLRDPLGAVPEPTPLFLLSGLGLAAGLAWDRIRRADARRPHPGVPGSNRTPPSPDVR